MNPSRLTDRIAQRAKRYLVGGQTDVYSGDDPVEFLETEMYLADTNEPMVLHPEQRAVLREMFRRDENGFVYSTMVYSSIKKSAKTTIAGGLLAWQGFRVRNGEIYIIGNDLRQADSRIAQVVKDCIALNPRMKDNIKLPSSASTFRDVLRIILPNRTRIETIPVDPTGESGMNPTAIFVTEAWGAKTTAHELMWTEARLSPTRQGESFKFVESYAGHSGESLILERLYHAIVEEGEELTHIAPELYAKGKMIAYWNTRPYLPWQTDEYYEQEAADMLPKEFRRVHRNEWVTSEDNFVDAIWWDGCESVDLPAMHEDYPQLMAVDAGITSDCFAVVCLCLHEDKYAVCDVKVWTPPIGGKLDFKGEGSPDEYMREYIRQNNVLELAYDPHQLHTLMSDYQNEDIVPIHQFNQGEPRLLADKGLRDSIKNRELIHDGNPVLRSHVLNANAKTEGSDSRLRIVKRHHSLKIDAAVALSMVLERAKRGGLLPVIIDFDLAGYRG